jgi:hypothetical protein
MYDNTPRRKSSYEKATWGTTQIIIYVKMTCMNQVYSNCSTHAQSNNLRTIQIYYFTINCMVCEFSKEFAKTQFTTCWTGSSDYDVYEFYYILGFKSF